MEAVGCFDFSSGSLGGVRILNIVRAYQSEMRACRKSSQTPSQNTKSSHVLVIWLRDMADSAALMDKAVTQAEAPAPGPSPGVADTPIRRAAVLRRRSRQPAVCREGDAHVVE